LSSISGLSQSATYTAHSSNKSSDTAKTSSKSKEELLKTYITSSCSLGGSLSSALGNKSIDLNYSTDSLVNQNLKSLDSSLSTDTIKKRLNELNSKASTSSSYTNDAQDAIADLIGDSFNYTG